MTEYPQRVSPVSRNTQKAEDDSSALESGQWTDRMGEKPATHAVVPAALRTDRFKKFELALVVDFDHNRTFDGITAGFFVIEGHFSGYSIIIFQF